MSRIAAALQRARTRSGPSLGVPDDAGASVAFFDPTQSAVVSPEVVKANAGRTPAGNPRRHVEHDGASSAARLPSRIERTFFTDLRPLDSRADRATGDADSPLFPTTLTLQGREQYRKLTATLYQAQLEQGVKVVIVTSAMPGEGKTFTATNLAAAFSESQRRRVLLIDADLRNPMVHQVFGISNARGLADSLAKDGPLPLTQVAARLSLLTAGQSGGDPLETLTSDRLRALILEARDTFDWILLDTPPVGLVSDAKVLASLADATVFVVLAEKTAYDVVQGAVEALGPDRIVGVVLNRVNGSAWPYADAAEEYFGRR